MKMPRTQVAISALLCDFTYRAITSVNALVDPVRIRMPIRLPMKPQTRMTQATSSSVITRMEVSAKPPMNCSP